MRIDPEFEELYRSQFEPVLKAVWALCGNRSVAEDATQEAFARALERWRRLRGEPWAAGWVTTTALNTARRALRRRRDVTAGGSSTDPDLDQDADLWRAVRALPRRQQEAVVLHYAVDLPVAEVARAMRCEPGTVKSHLARAREALRGRLEEARDD